METIYLIGGSGFIGKHLVKEFAATYELIVFDKYIDEQFFDAIPNVTTVQMDLVKEQIPSQYATPHYIFNLASLVTAARDLSLFDELIASNLKILRIYSIGFKEKNH